MTIDVLANDEPNDDGMPPDPSTLAIIANPKHGAAEVTADHEVEYTPATGFDGASDTFQYQVCVGNRAGHDVDAHPDRRRRGRGGRGGRSSAIPRT